MNKHELKNVIVEIDEVEYLVDEKSAQDISDNKKVIKIKRLFDGEDSVIDRDKLVELLKANTVDRLD